MSDAPLLHPSRVHPEDGPTPRPADNRLLASLARLRPPRRAPGSGPDLLQGLRRHLVPPPAGPAGPRPVAEVGFAPPAPPPLISRQSLQRFGHPGRWLRWALGAAVGIVALGFLYDRFFALGAGRAVLTPVPITLRAPIGGTLEAMPAQVGAVLAAGARLAGIRNDRADDSRLGELRAALGTSTALIAALADRLAATEAEIARAEAFANVFRQTRMEQLAARREEARAQIAAAQARLQEAESALRRGTALQASGTASVATGDQARRNAQVAQGELSAANEREIAIRTELAAAATGVFAGDQANDRSASQQLLDRLRPLRQEIAAQLAAQRGRATALADQLARETERLAGQAGAEILLPARSRILSLRAQPGEHVVAGQELAVLQDCAQARVVAEVDLRTFRALHLGMPAEFAPASGEARRAGEVVQLLLPLEAGPLAGETPRFRVEVRLAAAAADAARCDPVQTGSLRFP